MERKKKLNRIFLWLAPMLVLSIIVSIGAVYSLSAASAAGPTLGQSISGENADSIQQMLQASGYSVPAATVIWGVDSTSPINSTFLNQIKSRLGTPSFIGRYLDARSFSPMSASEAAFIHKQKIHIMPIQSDFGGHTTAATGTAHAKDAIAKARALHIPAKTVIFDDIENSSTVRAPDLVAWYKTIAAAGYTPGYYENPLPGSSGFTSAFCSAVKSDAAVGKSILYSTERDTGMSARSKAPAFHPTSVTCSGRVTGHTFAWQYGLSNGSINVDTDEYEESSIPIW